MKDNSTLTCANQIHSLIKAFEGCGTNCTNLLKTPNYLLWICDVQNTYNTEVYIVIEGTWVV
ncbi:MAG: hypothetical protein HUJ51_01635 [Eggerthellaceae bacterium]|nr:hypothetical protein [Eggerthellaceae bacterium]